MVSQPHCNCIHFHSGGFITYHKLELEFVLLQLIAANDIWVPVRDNVGDPQNFISDKKMHPKEDRGRFPLLAPWSLLLQYCCVIFHNCKVINQFLACTGAYFCCWICLSWSFAVISCEDSKLFKCTTSFNRSDCWQVVNIGKMCASFGVVIVE